MTRLPQLLFGRGVFAPVHHVLEELPLERMGDRPSGLPHSIFEELWHLDYWQRELLARARGERSARSSDSAADWPGQAEPAGAEEWSDLLESVRVGLDEAAAIAADVEVLDRSLGEERTVRGVIEDIVAHNAYHLGRIVTLRQLQGLWPPHGIE